MTKSRGMAMVLLVVALFAFPAWSKVDQAAVGKGTSELGLSFSYMQQSFGITNSADDSGTLLNSTYSALLNYGYFLNKNWEIGASYLYSQSWYQWGGDFTNDWYDLHTGSGINSLFDLRGTYNINISSQPALLPYVALKLGYYSYHETGMTGGGSGASGGLALGIRYFVSRQGALNLELDYDALGTTKLEYKDFELDIDNPNQLALLVGASIFFGGGK